MEQPCQRRRKAAHHGSAQLQPCQAQPLQHSPAWTDPEAWLGMVSHHSQWSSHVVTGTFSCGLRGCGSKLSSQPEQALKQLPTKPTDTSWSKQLVLMPSSLTETPHRGEAQRAAGCERSQPFCPCKINCSASAAFAVRGHGPPVHTNQLLCFSSICWFAAHFPTTLGSLLQESPSMSLQLWTPPTTDVCLHL